MNKRVAQAFFNTLNEIAPEIDVDTCDLYAAPPPFINSRIIEYFWYPPDAGGYEPTTEDLAARQFIREQCARLVAADILVLTAPVWNYGVPAIMKS